VKEDYKQTVREMLDLSWDKLNPEELQQLMVLSGYAAREFAESLRIAVRRYPHNPKLRQMASEELKTKNLSFGDYDRRGDHAEFIWFFINENYLGQKFTEANKSGEDYLANIRNLNGQIRSMSIFSREHELPGIFAKILKAKNCKLPGLPEFNYYLRRHIELDSQEGGHSDLVKDFPLDDRLNGFYRARLELYKPIKNLWTK